MARTYLAVIVALVGALVLGGTALAEGTWVGHIHGAKPGFNSRSWTDRNSDGLRTTIRFQGCTARTVEVQLTRETPWWQPDENRGRRTLECAGSDREFWGDEEAGNYHFTITNFDGAAKGHRLDVRAAQVDY